MSVAQCQQLYELQKKAGLIKGEKTPESSRAIEARVTMLEAKSEISSNESLFADVKPNASNRNNPALDREGNGSRQPCRCLMVRVVEREQSAQHAEK